MKKKMTLAMATALLAALLLSACGSQQPTQTTTQPTTEATQPTETTQAPETTEPETDSNETKTIVLSDYFSQDVWEDDGGDVYVEDDHILFDNGYMGDFSTLMLKEEAKNVTYRFTLKLENIPTDLSEEEGTWWDSELMILARSSLLAPGWEDGQTGYSLTAWGDMKKVAIGRAGHDDAFGFIDWNVADGQEHEIEFSLTNNEDDTEVTIVLKIDGETVFETVDDGSIVKEDRIPLFPEGGNLTIRSKYLQVTVG